MNNSGQLCGAVPAELLGSRPFEVEVEFDDYDGAVKRTTSLPLWSRVLPLRIARLGSESAHARFRPLSVEQRPRQ